MITTILTTVATGTEIIPIPDELGEKLWKHDPLVYLLVVAVVGLVLALMAVFAFYRQAQHTHADFIAKQLDEHRRLEKERRDDALENLRVLGSLSHVLEGLTKETERGVASLRAEIHSAALQTQAHVTAQMDSLKLRLK
ncbi:hypothetical protein [Thiocapsa sp. N5-Cardenillas]|uniref:hypothetical protein n=1 Tax=Thiocapsa sp. N5-Cardenillas TaxID=3137397 RepID=UPI0035B09F82